MTMRVRGYLCHLMTSMREQSFNWLKPFDAIHVAKITGESIRAGRCLHSSWPSYARHLFGGS